MEHSVCHLALDAGGTKVIGILFDEAFRPLAAHRIGSLRSNTTSQELIDRNIENMLEGLSLRGRHIGTVCGMSDPALLERIRAVCEVDRICTCGEYEAGMNAAELFEDGILALSGTGATMFCHYKGNSFCTGGYGAAVADTGSGYWIGREALNAAIEADEGRGPDTLLTALIADYFGCPKEQFRNAVFRIYAQTEHSPAACVASCAPLVTKAAEQGDDAACQILRTAGRKIGEQVMSMVRQNRLPRTLPVTISGSVWRGHPILFSAFRHVLSDAGMERKVKIPAFEPVIGAIIGEYVRTYGTFGPAEHELFLTRYPEYTFMVSSDIYQKSRTIPTYLL